MMHVVASAAGTAILAAGSRGSCPLMLSGRIAAVYFFVQGWMESEDGLAGTEEPPGLKKRRRKIEASFCLLSQGQTFHICASLWVERGNGIWVDLGEVGDVERIGVGNSKGSKKWLSSLWKGVYSGRWEKRTRNKNLKKWSRRDCTSIDVFVSCLATCEVLEVLWESIPLGVADNTLKKNKISHYVLALQDAVHCSAGTMLVLAGRSCLACCFVFVSRLLVIPQLYPWWQEVPIP